MGRPRQDGNYPEEQTDRIRLWILLGAIFLASFSLIAFEVTLSRLLSVLLSYHYVFIILSLALLGLGLGGLFVLFFRPSVPAGDERFALLAFFSSLFSLAIPSSVLILIKIGYVQAVQINLLFYGLILLIPFFWAGVILAEVYRLFPGISAKVYGADLIGAALGSFGAILLLNNFASISAHLILGVTASLAAALFAISGGKRSHRGLASAVLSLVFLCALLGIDRMGFLPEIPIGKNPSKEIHDALSSFQGKIAESRWSAFGRTDLVAFHDDPDHMDIYLDGTAGSPMYRFGGDIQHPGATIQSLRDTFPGYFPFLFLREDAKDHALIIGPGGGRDILLASMGGVRQMTAVEINPDLVDIVKKYSWYNGGIYSQLPQVRIIMDEGRNFLKRQKTRYDVIMFSLPVTNTSRSLEGYALTENFLFTTDSIRDYLDHLTEEGQLMVVGHNDPEILRLLSVSLDALRKQGIHPVQAMNQIYIVASDDYLLFVLKKTPFEPAAVLPMVQAMHRLGYDSRSSFFPHMAQGRTLNPALMALSHGNMTFEDLKEMVRKRGYDISPVTDDNPFFYKIEKGIPNAVLCVFWSSVILLVLILLIPPLYERRRSIQRGSPSRERGYFHKISLKFVVFFSMLGIGFMLVEISFFQRFVFFLGQPVLSLGLLLFALLGGAGLGSIWSGRLVPNKIDRGIARASLSIFVMALAYTFFLPTVLHHLLGLTLIARLWITFLLLLPPGFLMGIPFPLGIRLLKERHLETQIPWMWGINGVSSVLGSAAALWIAIRLGFTEVLLLSAGCYFIIFLIFFNSSAPAERIVTK